jgi:hypothetical protein
MEHTFRRGERLEVAVEDEKYGPKNASYADGRRSAQQEKLLRTPSDAGRDLKLPSQTRKGPKRPMPTRTSLPFSGWCVTSLNKNAHTRTHRERGVNARADAVRRADACYMRAGEALAGVVACCGRPTKSAIWAALRLKVCCVGLSHIWMQSAVKFTSEIACRQATAAPRSEPQRCASSSDVRRCT